MMNPDEPFTVDVGRLRRRPKDVSTASMDRSDSAGEKHGFVGREPNRKRGRPASPRTGQIHAKVMPDIADAIADVARRRGVQQGVVLEDAWALYTSHQGPQTNR